MKSYERFLIPHVSNHIDRVLKKLDLAPDIMPEAFIKAHEGRKHRYATSATNTKTGKSVIFYARLHNNEDARNKFAQDVRILDKLSRGHYLLSHSVPNIYSYSLRKGREWLVRENLIQPCMGNTYQTKIHPTKKQVPQFVKLFHALQTLPTIPHHHYERRDADFFLQISEGNLRQIKFLFSPSERAQTISHLHAAYSRIQSETKHLVHGDCHPGNILIGPRRLFVIDWETTQKNLRTTDIGYFYLSLSSEPSFRREFLRSLYRHITWKKQLREFFPLSALFFALNHLYALSLNPTKELSLKEKRAVMTFAQAVVKNAAKGYTAFECL